MCETLGTNWEETAKQQISERIKVTEALERVLELHKSNDDGMCSECYKYYTYYAEKYPCPTIKALEGEIND